MQTVSHTPPQRASAGATQRASVAVTQRASVAVTQRASAGITRRASVGVSLTVLIATHDFGPQLKAEAVAAAIAAGITESGFLQADLCTMEELQPGGQLDARIKAARAVVIAARRLDESTLLGSLPFEIATRARQTGVPAYAVTHENALEPFDARILDLQVVIQARSPRALRQAGAELATIV